MVNNSSTSSIKIGLRKKFIMIRMDTRNCRGSGVYISREEYEDINRIAKGCDPLSANVKEIYNYVKEINPYQWNLLQLQNM